MSCGASENSLIETAEGRACGSRIRLYCPPSQPCGQGRLVYLARPVGAQTVTRLNHRHAVFVGCVRPRRRARD